MADPSTASPSIPHIGLTGNIGSGKSTVARHFADLGAAVIDADQLARDATRDPEVLHQIAEQLGADLITDGQLDRAKTAERVFNDEDARQTLNRIVHPRVGLFRKWRVNELMNADAPPPLIVSDIPLLYETGLEPEFDAVVVVYASLDTRIRRVQERSGLSEEEIRARDAAQMPLEDKCDRADYIIDNDGSVDALAAQVEQVFQQLTGGSTQ